jgi:hypothetical protein
MLLYCYVRALFESNGAINRGPRPVLRNDWSLAEVRELFALPFLDLVFNAQQTHRQFQARSAVQVSTLLSSKTSARPEDCAYCPQSVRYDTGASRRSTSHIPTMNSRCASRPACRYWADSPRLPLMTQTLQTAFAGAFQRRPFAAAAAP